MKLTRQPREDRHPDRAPEPRPEPSRNARPAPEPAFDAAWLDHYLLDRESRELPERH